MVDKACDIFDLIQTTDILITFFSTAALQALYTGKPVINVEFEGSGGVPVYSQSGATWVARSEDEIAMHIRNLIGDKKDEEIKARKLAKEKFLQDMAYSPDGCATRRIVKICKDILS